MKKFSDKELAKMSSIELHSEAQYLRIYGKDYSEEYIRKVEKAASRAWLRDFDKLLEKMPKIRFAEI